MNKIEKAIKHVQSFIPSVDRVVYWNDCRWAFMNDEHEVVSFESYHNIDVGILEDAADSVPTLPYAVQLMD